MGRTSFDENTHHPSSGKRMADSIILVLFIFSLLGGRYTGIFIAFSSLLHPQLI
jgi:hypothetical protein